MPLMAKRHRGIHTTTYRHIQVTKDRQVVAPDKRKSEVRENPRASLMTCMTRRKPSWMKAVGRFVKTIRSAREEEGIDSFKKKANRASDNKHHHTSKSGRAVIGKPPCPSHDQPVQLWSFTQVIPKRFTRTAPASSPMTSNPAQNQNSRSSESISMISTKSSTSLPINKPAVSDNESFIAPLDASSLPFTLLPLLDTATFEPFSFEPNDLIEELR
ncbi:hypothetical protein PCASD_06381 [Puccinia coronata f. sp. avenae]|uniref:Uncharacterized protein n=1 Tax=Puccinia coronata f. sp. avenae TaxID=200324 RepID=A0A2N5UXE4_9BASI|nr:hypothetical protein PCASD_06381 [Puccinia coronata f. sp. avenae]